MTYFPDYLKTYPNMHSSFPFHISKNTLEHGFRAHRHDFLEFSYVIEGTGSESINDVTHKMRSGTFTFVLPYQVHEIFTDPGQKLVLYNCMFSMDLLMESGNDPGLSGLLGEMTALPAYVQLHGHDQQLMLALLEEIYQEYNGTERYRQTLLKGKLKEILIRFDRYRWKQTLPLEEVEIPPLPGTKSNHAVWPIIHYIHRNYQEELALSDLASQFSMSASRISEVIKQTTGQTFVHFLHDLRLRHACSLLVSTDMSVTEIAHEVGYGSYKTFSRIFRESKGIVPKDYRKSEHHRRMT
ncbi:AraC family transcriptional regulator [Paenibacillus aceris]|uniref:AraC-like DNA-binding protein n=1 Tax=Paenibacillus aceris TaxID=869555 RepID=A0ABS4I4U0_9BACL|nr:AraC family transcriptional regulator [Paenibacillus aceris]MBP1965947.1 AraC-like DNA-binding protein [Paenibacillus aceris]NHW35056.1 AraC family transcriptional regulator [Paenibacillus aceris]